MPLTMFAFELIFRILATLSPDGKGQSIIQAGLLLPSKGKHIQTGTILYTPLVKYYNELLDR